MSARCKPKYKTIEAAQISNEFKDLGLGSIFPELVYEPPPRSESDKEVHREERLRRVSEKMARKTYEPIDL